MLERGKAFFLNCGALIFSPEWQGFNLQEMTDYIFPPISPGNNFVPERGNSCFGNVLLFSPCIIPYIGYPEHRFRLRIAPDGDYIFPGPEHWKRKEVMLEYSNHRKAIQTAINNLFPCLHLYLDEIVVPAKGG